MPREQSRVLSQNTIGGLTPFRPLNGLQEITPRNSRKAWSSLFHSRRGLTRRVNLEFNPRSLSPLERNKEFLDPSRDEVYLPCIDSRAIHSSPSQLEWRLDIPEATQEAPGVTHRNSGIPPQLEENHEVPQSSRDDALSQCSVSR